PDVGGSRLHGPLRLRLGDQGLEVEAEVPRQLPALVVQQVAVTLNEEQPGHRRLAARPGDEAAAQLRQLLPRPHVQGVSLLHEPPPPAGRRPIQLVEQLLLRGEVPVDGPFRDACLFRYEWRRGYVVALRGEQLECGADQSLAGQLDLAHVPAVTGCGMRDAGWGMRGAASRIPLAPDAQHLSVAPSSPE